MIDKKITDFLLKIKKWNILFIVASMKIGKILWAKYPKDLLDRVIIHYTFDREMDIQNKH